MRVFIAVAALMACAGQAAAHDWFVGKRDPVTGGSCCTTAANAASGDCAQLKIEPGVLTGDDSGLGYRLRLTAEQASRINPHRKTPVDTLIPWDRIQESYDGKFYVCIPNQRLESMMADFYCFWGPPAY